MVSLGQFLSADKNIEMTPSLLTQMITYLPSEQLPWPKSMHGTKSIIRSLMILWPKLSRMYRWFSQVPIITLPRLEDQDYFITPIEEIESFSFRPSWKTCSISQARCSGEAVLRKDFAFGVSKLALMFINSAARRAGLSWYWLHTTCSSNSASTSGTLSLKLSMSPRNKQRPFSAASPITGCVLDSSSQYSMMAVTFFIFTGFQISLLEPLYTMSWPCSSDHITSLPYPSPRISEIRKFEFLERVGSRKPQMNGDFFIARLYYHSYYNLNPKQFILLSPKSKNMFFCGTCTNQKQKQHEIEIRASNDADVFKRVSRDNEQLLSTIMKEIPSFTMVVPSDYEKELKNCREKNKKFVDNSFPPNAKSLNFSINNRKIVWKRITEIVSNAKLVQDDINPADVQQGNVGDCYFLACIASIAEVPQRIRRIFCHDMEISQEGIYRMQIVEQGVYKEVVIDDFVPVFEGTNRPVFCRPIGNQVWVMLLEKVWAKLSGSYGDTSAGYPHEVLSTFLVAPCFYEDIPFQILKQQNQMQRLWQKLKQASKHDMPICAGSRQAYTCKGIKAAHTYSILETYQLESLNIRTRLLKLRNPWGDAQYMGRYSEHDTAFWATVSPTLKLAIFQKQSENDGIFTIEFSQFVRNFQCVDISHDVPDYNNFFTKVQAKSCEPVFFELKIENISALDCYITVEKAFDRNAYVRTRRVEYGYSRLLIARKKQVLINNELKVTYQYVSSLLQTNFPDLTIRQQSLTPGTYTIMAQTEFPTQATGQLTVSIYSKSIMNLQPIPIPDRYFLHAVLTNHAHTLVPVGQRVRLSEESIEDWMVSRFLFREGGYGYTCVVLGPGSREKVQITGNIGKIYQSGFLVQQRNIKKQEGELNILVEKNQQSIIIFQIDFKRDIKKIAFPPKGLRMARII